MEFQGDLKSLSEENYQKLKSEILQTGFAFPIYVWQSKDGVNYILGGHQRTRVLRRLKQENYDVPNVPVVLIEADNVKQAKRRIVQDVSQYGHVEKDGLYEFMNGESELGLEDLKKSFDIPGVDLDSFALEFFEDNAVAPGEDDENIEPPVEPKSKLGDLWTLGNHRLLCGDSTMIDAVERLMDGKKADMVFTDPPYGIGIDGQKESHSKNPKHNRKHHEFMGWDDKRPDKSIFDYILFLSIPSIIFGGNYFSDLLPPTRGWIYWSKGQDGLTMSDGELAWTNIDKPLRCVTVNRGAIGESFHPTQKPIKVINFCLEYAGDCQKVLDLFGGSGSTLIACEQTKRHCYMMELEPKYIDVILNRWSKLTGKDPVRDDGVKWSSLNG